MTPTTGATIDSASVDNALAHGVLCRTLKLGFQPPDQSNLDSIFSPDGTEALQLAAAQLEAGRRGPLSDVVERFCVLPKPWAESLVLAAGKCIRP